MVNHCLTTESTNPNTTDIDRKSLSEILTLINQEDQKISFAIQNEIPSINNAVEICFNAIKNGGKVFLVGAGTSGRLAVLEASECPPTFGVSHHLFQGMIAGGEKAMFKSIESAEDDEEQGGKDLEQKGLTDQDVVIGIAASGKTPYVIGALKYANQQEAMSIALTCNKASQLGQIAHHRIEVVVGPEVISGSTRMKAGTATKMVLNMMTTSTMIKLGKVYQNLMVDLNVSNNKLRDRAVHIVQIATQVDAATAQKILEASGFDVKSAIVMIKRHVDFLQAKQILEDVEGYVRAAIKE